LAARLIALVVAVAMVVGALAVRARWDDDDNGGDGNEPSGALRLVCAPELEAVCEQIANGADRDVEVTVEDAGITADRLATAPRADIDGWLTPGPWPQIVDVLRAGQPKLFGPVTGPIAHSRVGLVMWNDRSARLSTHCGGAVTWRCIGDAAGKQWSEIGGEPTWGAVRMSLPDATTSASGVAVLGAATVGYFGRPDVSTIDFDEDPGFGGWLAALARANPNVDLDRMLAAGPSLAAGIGVIAADAAERLQPAAISRRARLIYPAPVTTVGVVFAGMPGSRGNRLSELVTKQEGPQAVRAAGWTAGAGPGGLPIPGLLQALRTRWESIR
jgi:hypothetical protein